MYRFSDAEATALPYIVSSALEDAGIQAEKEQVISCSNRLQRNLEVIITDALARELDLIKAVQKSAKDKVDDDLRREFRSSFIDCLANTFGIVLPVAATILAFLLIVKWFL